MKKYLQTTVLVFLQIIMLVAMVGAFPKTAAATAYAPDFQAGNIIGDALFFDGGSMSTAQIQAFLNQQVPSCDTNGTQTSEYGGGTRAQYGASRGYPAPYICLKDYYENPSNLANNLGGSIPSGAISAAQIISNAAMTYGVSPKVLLTTIQKESGLVTDAWPFPSQYKTATGYGCPDTAPCDAQYYGFYNQVTNAAQQFQRYATNPSIFRYKAGQNNTIQYNPNTSCGSSTVYVQNQATAGLYNYTPYQPNQAAINNLYGTGDSCSSYGNRNFWRMYTDWFGSTLGSDLVRTANDATVYLISGAYRYPIADGNVLNDFSALGSVLYVSDAYISAHSLGAPLGHMVGGSDGTIYFVNAGIKLPFSSCAMVSSYGYSCNSIIYLNDVQLSKLSTGPYITSLYKTTSGRLFYITGGVKREVFDQQSLTNAGISDSTNLLLPGGVAYLPYGQPVVRDDVVVYNRDDTKYYLYDSGNFWTLNQDMMNLSYINRLPTSSLDDASISSTLRKGPLTGFASDASNAANKYLLAGTGKIALTNPASWTASYNPLSTQLLAGFTNGSDPLNNQIIKSSSDGTVYYVSAATKRPIAAWTDLLSLQIAPLVINTLNNTEISQIPTGATLYGIGTLIKSANSGTVYIVKSGNQLVTISSFTYPQELGIPLYVRTISDADLSTYSIASSIQSKIACSGAYYIGNMGKLYSVSQTQMTQYGFSAGDFVDGGSMCANLPQSQQSLGSYIRTSDGTIYMVQSGHKQAFTSYTAYLAHGGTASNTVQVSDYFATQVAAGANISQ